MTRRPFYRRLGGPQGRPGRVRKISPQPRFDPRSVQHVSSRNIHYTIPTHDQLQWRIKTIFVSDGHFEVNDLVYLYTPAMKAGQTKKFQKFWSGPYKITRKILELNYEIVGQDDKKSIVHVNRLKKCYDPSLWKPRQNEKTQNFVWRIFRNVICLTLDTVPAKQVPTTTADL